MLAVLLGAALVDGYVAAAPAKRRGEVRSAADRPHPERRRVQDAVAPGSGRRGPRRAATTMRHRAEPAAAPRRPRAVDVELADATAGLRLVQPRDAAGPPTRAHARRPPRPPSGPRSPLVSPYTLSSRRSAKVAPTPTSPLEAELSELRPRLEAVEALDGRRGRGAARPPRLRRAGVAASFPRRRRPSALRLDFVERRLDFVERSSPHSPTALTSAPHGREPLLVGVADARLEATRTKAAADLAALESARKFCGRLARAHEDASKASSRPSDRASHATTRRRRGPRRRRPRPRRGPSNRRLERVRATAQTDGESLRAAKAARRGGARLGRERRKFADGR